MALPSPTARSSSSDSPEFEFNPSFPSPTSLHSADQLFFRGLLLPLHLLPATNSTDHTDQVQISSEINPVSAEPSDPPAPATDPSPSPSILFAGTASSKRWSHMFKKTDKKPPDEEDKTKNKDSHKQRSEKEKKKDTRKISGAGGSNSAELNINLWPFSRSRSAGNNSGGRTRSSSAATRKVSSAPCSRSNSAGESKSRRNWPTSPARSGGVHLSRTSPVWQLPRTSSGKGGAEVNRRSKAVKAAGANTGGKGRVLSLNVPMCIGYRPHLSCRSDEASAVGGGEGVAATEESGAGGGSRIVGGSSGSLFSLRSLFSKKVY